jgi:transcriptional regulator with XRE-family HTH domain
MKTIGQIIKEARVGKKLSLASVEEITKIKSSFIDSIERERWEKLPAFPTVLGFVKSIAGALGIDGKTAVAVFKRDYPPKKLSINPKPDVVPKFVWSPKLTFIFGVGAVLLVIFGYLIFQYIHFVSPPNLLVESPKDGQLIDGNTVMVFGSTEADSKIMINNQPVLVDENGKFSVTLEITKDTKEIVVKSISRSGKESIISRKIDVQE